MIAGRLFRALVAAGIPVISVSIGVDADRATWRIDYAAGATAQQRADGEALRLSFDPLSQVAIDAEKAARAARVDDDLLIQAVAMLDFEERQKLVVAAGQTLRTLQQCRARVRAIYLSLLP